MDHRKLLVVILSVTLFAALVLGISLLALYPGGDRAAEGVRTADSRRVFDPIEYVRSSDGPIGIIEDEDEDPDEQDGDVVIVYGSRRETEDAAGRAARDSDTVETAEVPAETTADADAPVEPQPAPEQPAAPRQPAPQQPRPSTQPSQPAAQTAPQQTRPAPSQPEPPTPDTRTAAVRTTGSEYWIQVVSSPNRDTVEQARETLSERSLGSVIFPVEIEGRRFYRLRIGPYPDRQEADKFLVWIRDLPGFDDSYVSVVFRS
ncbi:MAG: hypothetical protein EA383_17765 [Spirochaetaceae bacterium]|nr:MAG: hypothetical protein EA383_17765 [Spirochaetaceae bacterium]